jgi:hypothetical protein
MAPHGKQMTPEEKQIIVVFLQTGCFLYPSKFKRLRTVLEEILVTNWRLNWSVISPKLCLLSERSTRYIILSPRTPVFLSLPLRGKFSSDPRTRRLLRNLLIVTGM